MVPKSILGLLSSRGISLIVVVLAGSPSVVKKEKQGGSRSARSKIRFLMLCAFEFRQQFNQLLLPACKVSAQSRSNASIPIITLAVIPLTQTIDY